MILTSQEMKALEERAFAEGVSAEGLMDEAGYQIGKAVEQFFPTPGTCVAVFGKGHNGGDALVAGRHLAEAGWEVHLVPAFGIANWAPLTRRKFDEASRCHQHAPGGKPVWDELQAAGRQSSGPLVILDGLLGIGASGALRDPLGALCRLINSARHSADAQVFALDLPTGLNGDTGEADPDTIVADVTLTIGAAKPGLLEDSAMAHVGRLAIIPLTELSARIDRVESEIAVGAPDCLADLLPRRRFDSHKGDYGRVSIIAGSVGMVGAGAITSAACVHAGAGLITLYVPADAYGVAASLVEPEVMVRPVENYTEILDTKPDVIAIGPGIGQTRSAEVLSLIRSATQPMVIDADGLNILATDLGALFHSAGPRLLTPHPGEMARLFPECAGYARRKIVRHWLEQHPGVLLLKGSRTIVGERRRPFVYNTTGNPGMGSGGMGDALTGVLAALAGQGLSLYDAAQVGPWICGRAAEIAVAAGGDSVESLSATSVIRHLGAAFNSLRARDY